MSLKNAWDCSLRPRPFLGYFVKNVNREMGQICNISIWPLFTIKLGKKPPKMAKFAAANEPTAIYIYIYMVCMPDAQKSSQTYNLFGSVFLYVISINAQAGIQLV